MSVGLALIARDEAKRLPALLGSIDGAFDRVVLLDTGSKDDTIDIFAAWAKDQTGMTFSVAQFEWKDDFAAARAAADTLLMYGTVIDPPMPGPIRGTPMVDWTCWADCDDRIANADQIHRLCEQAPSNVVAFLCGYSYAHSPDGACISYLWRERMVRAGHGTWGGRVHEAQHIEGGMVQPVDPSVTEWVHHKHDVDVQQGVSNKRNLRILRKWHKDDPTNLRVISYLGVENAMMGNRKAAIRFYRKYLAGNPEWTEEAAQVCRRLGMEYIADQNPKAAIDTALDGIKMLPSWTDNYITLAEAYLMMGEPEKAAEWARQAMDRGAPKNTLLIINPTDYTFLPRKLLAAALADMGDTTGAVTMANEALKVVYDDMLARAASQWQSVAKRERTADTIVLMAEQLIAHDEQMKALVLLNEAVPHFAQDHPKVVAIRSMLRERLHWVDNPEAFADHYTTGGSKPEDFIKDEDLDPLCEYLPRTNFALHDILEMAGA